MRSLNEPLVGKYKYNFYSSSEFPTRRQRRKMMSSRRDENFVYLNAANKVCKEKDAVKKFHFTRGFRPITEYETLNR